MGKLKVGDRVEVRVKAGTFNGRSGVIAYASDIHGRWFVQLDGDKKGDCVEFMPKELVPDESIWPYDEMNSLRADLRRAMEALEPFRHYYIPDGDKSLVKVYPGRIRRAAEAYANLKAKYPAPAEGEGK
jgi:hypothetical protein